MGRGVPVRWVAPQTAIGSDLAERRDRKRPCCGTSQVEVGFRGGCCAGGGAMGEAEKFHYIYSCDLDINVRLKM